VNTLFSSDFSTEKCVAFLCTCSCYCRAVTQSQNHRMFGVGRDLCGSSSPTLLPKKGHLELTAQDLVQVEFEYLQSRRLHNPSGQPVPVLRHAQNKEVLPHVQMELPVLQLCTRRLKESQSLGPSPVPLIHTGTLLAQFLMRFWLRL